MAKKEKGEDADDGAGNIESKVGATTTADPEEDEEGEL